MASGWTPFIAEAPFLAEAPGLQAAASAIYSG